MGADSSESVPTSALGYSLLRSDFEAKTLRLLKLSRAALIYLSLGMHAEERRRANAVAKNSVEMKLGEWDDELKH